VVTLLKSVEPGIRNSHTIPVRIGGTEGRQ
jgi:hypothetical protein